MISVRCKEMESGHLTKQLLAWLRNRGTAPVDEIPNRLRFLLRKLEHYGHAEIEKNEDGKFLTVHYRQNKSKNKAQ